MGYSVSRAVFRDSDGNKAFAMDYSVSKAVARDSDGNKAFAMDSNRSKATTMKAPHNGALEAPARDSDGSKAPALDGDVALDATGFLTTVPTLTGVTTFSDHLVCKIVV